MAAGKKDKKQKQDVYSYVTKECTHIKLSKIAPMWYVCDRCGRIFNYILSLQFNLQEALEYQEKIIKGIEQNKKKIQKAEKAEEKRDKKAEKDAREKIRKQNKEFLEKQKKTNGEPN